MRKIAIETPIRVGRTSRVRFATYPYNALYVSFSDVKPEGRSAALPALLPVTCGLSLSA